MDFIHFAKQIENQYETFKEKKLNTRRFKHTDIIELIHNLKQNSLFEIYEAGKSTEGREIYLIKAGNGKTKIFLWSQMHGNEPTATAALFDIFNWLTDNRFKAEATTLLNQLTLYFLPLVNPDGAQVNKRRNAFDIDLNRDAARLQAVETQMLKNLRDDINPEIGFNLHDQEIYYTAGSSPFPAAVSFLAPSFNFEKEIDQKRRTSMEMIVIMNKVMQQYIPAMVGRYNDDFMPTAFGDNMQKWGTSTILIESGGYKNDPEKQLIRKMNFLCIMSALYELAQGKKSEIDYMDYFTIPENKKEKLFDLLIRKASLKIDDKSFIIDIGIRRKEIENEDYTGFSYKGEIVEIGDLTYYYGFDEIDASNMCVETNNKYLLIGDVANFNLNWNYGKPAYCIENGFVKE